MEDRVPGDVLFDGDLKIANLQNTHAACVILLDVSGSMKPAIDMLNDALVAFHDQICEDKNARNIVDVAVVAFGNNNVEVLSEFQPIKDWQVNRVVAGGNTPMGEALVLGIHMAKERSRSYQNLGVDAHIPWLVVFTDGAPTDSFEQARILLEEEAKKGQYGHLKLWMVLTEGADVDFAKSLTKRVIYMKDKNYEKIFDWLADSMVMLSVSNPSNAVKVPDLPDNASTVIPDDWANG